MLHAVCMHEGLLTGAQQSPQGRNGHKYEHFVDGMCQVGCQLRNAFKKDLVSIFHVPRELFDAVIQHNETIFHENRGD